MDKIVMNNGLLYKDIYVNLRNGHKMCTTSRLNLILHECRNADRDESEIHNYLRI